MLRHLLLCFLMLHYLMLDYLMLDYVNVPLLMLHFKANQSLYSQRNQTAPLRGEFYLLCYLIRPL